MKRVLLLPALLLACVFTCTAGEVPEIPSSLYCLRITNTDSRYTDSVTLYRAPDRSSADRLERADHWDCFEGWPEGAGWVKVRNFKRWYVHMSEKDLDSTFRYIPADRLYKLTLVPENEATYSNGYVYSYGSIYYTPADSLEARVAPDASAPVAGKLTPGVDYRSLGIVEDGWLRIYADSGYVYAPAAQMRYVSHKVQDALFQGIIYFGSAVSTFFALLFVMLVYWAGGRLMGGMRDVRLRTVFVWVLYAAIAQGVAVAVSILANVCGLQASQSLAYAVLLAGVACGVAAWFALKDEIAPGGRAWKMMGLNAALLAAYMFMTAPAGKGDAFLMWETVSLGWVVTFPLTVLYLLMTLLMLVSLRGYVKRSPRAGRRSLVVAGIFWAGVNLAFGMMLYKALVAGFIAWIIISVLGAIKGRNAEDDEEEVITFMDGTELRGSHGYYQDKNGNHWRETPNGYERY